MKINLDALYGLIIGVVVTIIVFLIFIYLEIWKVYNIVFYVPFGLQL